MKCLIIVDMQNDFLDGPLGNEMCRAAIPEVVNLIESEDHTWDGIFVTQDTHFENYDKTLEGRKLPVPHCKFKSEGWKTNQKIVDVLEENYKFLPQFIYKPTFGSYELIQQIEFAINEWLSDPVGTMDNTALASRIAASGDGLEFHVCGVCTSICVLANVVLLRAKWPDAKIVVHAKACGDVTEEMHNAALVCFKSQQCDVE